jgi:hypothetical protein
VEGGVVGPDDVVAQLLDVPAGRGGVPLVAGDLARPVEERHVHQAVDDGPAALLRVVQVAPGLDDPRRRQEAGHQVVETWGSRHAR